MSGRGDSLHVPPFFCGPVARIAGVRLRSKPDASRSQRGGGGGGISSWLARNVFPPVFRRRQKTESSRPGQRRHCGARRPQRRADSPSKRRKLLPMQQLLLLIPLPLRPLPGRGGCREIPRRSSPGVLSRRDRGDTQLDDAVRVGAADSYEVFSRLAGLIVMRGLCGGDGAQERSAPPKSSTLLQQRPPQLPPPRLLLLLLRERSGERPHRGRGVLGRVCRAWPSCPALDAAAPPRSSWGGKKRNCICHGA